MKRRSFIMLLSGVGAWLLAPCAATAQPSERIRRIAVLGRFAANDPEAQRRVAALQQGLKELGWTESRNVSIEFRWGTGGAAQMRAFARELIDLKPDLIVGITTPAVAAVVQETNTIPILFVNIVDPLGRGFVSNMVRPGGNVTGRSDFRRRRSHRYLPPRRILRRPDLEGRQSRRSSPAGADQVRTGDQSEDCQHTGTHCAADAARTGRRGDRMRERHFEAGWANI
jgi:ABC transporter substrate binding protein